MIKSFKIALNPSSEQERAFESHAGGARACYNWCIRYAREKYLDGEKFSLRQIPLQNAWREHRNEIGAGTSVDRETGEINVWWDQNSKQVYEGACKAAGQAYSNFFDSLSGKRPGPRMGRPKTKKKGKAKLSFQFFEQVKLVGYHHISLPKISSEMKLGPIKTHESLRKIIGEKPVKIGTTTISKDSSGRWFASMVIYFADEAPVIPTPAETKAVGIDLGLKTLAVIADEAGKALWEEPNSRHLREAQIRLRRAQKALSRSKFNSGRYKAKKKKVGRIHARVRNLRKDQINKFTTKIADAFPVVVVEDLNVKGMVKNRKMAKAVSDAGFGEIRSQLSYKVNTLIVAGRWFASSKTCSGCGEVKAKLHLGERVYECEGCGLAMDRDVNAAVNLAGIRNRIPAVGYTVTGRGFPVSPSPGKARKVETSRPGNGSTLDGNAQVSTQMDLSNNVQE